MRLVWAWIAFAIVMMPSMALAAKDVSVDVNGGFEAGNGPFPANWLQPDGRSAIRASVDDAPEGESVLVFAGHTADLRSLPFGVGAGDELVVSAMVRDSSIPVEIGVEFFRHGTSLGQQTLGPRAPSVEWEEVTVHAFSPLGTTRAVVIIKGTPATISVVDDVRVAEG